MPLINYVVLSALVAELDALADVGAPDAAVRRRREDALYTVCVYTGVRDPLQALARARGCSPGAARRTPPQRRRYGSSPPGWRPSPWSPHSGAGPAVRPGPRPGAPRRREPWTGADQFPGDPPGRPGHTALRLLAPPSRPAVLPHRTDRPCRPHDRRFPAAAS
ncbi:DUF5133 domain-containing protein [Kitasatospora arboriphila]